MYLLYYLDHGSSILESRMWKFPALAESDSDNEKDAFVDDMLSRVAEQACCITREWPPHVLVKTRTQLLGFVFACFLLELWKQIVMKLPDHFDPVSQLKWMNSWWLGTIKKQHWGFHTLCIMLRGCAQCVHLCVVRACTLERHRASSQPWVQLQRLHRTESRGGHALFLC